MAAIINRALMDVQGGNLATGHARDDAMAWFHGHNFEAYAMALEIDPQRIRDRAADYYRQSTPDLIRPRGRPPKRFGSPAHKQPRMKKGGLL
ncbi:hypothetical protein FACS1894137_16790 [Spirochaetia bacterium]|nr:hypothetical protein FACS1894137_16790 [Spirochaetia bacterium]